MNSYRRPERAGTPARLGRWPTLRQTRLASGLILFAYVLEHLFNLALGNVSLAAMEEALRWQKLVWGWGPGALALYASLLTHLTLGFWALFARRRLRYTRLEATQVVLGLAIPFLLAKHFVATRAAAVAFGLHKGYAEELFTLWTGPTVYEAAQIALVLAVWSHGCIGIYNACVLRPWFARARQAFFAIALMTPTLALLGYLQGGRAVLLLDEDPQWRAAHASPESLGTPQQNAALSRTTLAIEAALIAALAATLLVRLGRAFHARRGAVVFAFPQCSVLAPRGYSVLEAAARQDIALAHVCGGRARCSTCRVRVISDLAALPAETQLERAVLDRIKAGVGVRLACQLRPLEDIAVVPLLPAQASAESVLRRNAAHFGNERYLVPMFVDMRDSTGLAERRLPFDTVFLINQFLEAASRAAFSVGGMPNQILGDGLLILFGLENSPAEAARQALACCWRIAENVRALNASLPPEISTPIRFGVGVHAGNVVVGDIGYERHMTFTAIGDAVNVASRLQDLSKTLGCEVVVSEDVCQRAGVDLAGFPAQEVIARGRAGAIQVRCVPLASQLKEVVAAPR